MIKRFLGILTVLIMLFCLVFSFFLKLGENANFSKTPIDYFPKNPVFLMGINEITKTFDHFTSTSMIWSKMENDFIDKGTLNLNQQFLKVLSNKDSSLISYFNRGKTFIGVYEISDSTHWIIGKNIYDHKIEKKIIDSIFRFENQRQPYLSYDSPFLTISSSQNLLKIFKENFLSGEKNHNDLTSKMSFSSQMAKVSCILDVNQFFEIYLDSSKSFLDKPVYSIIKNQDWIQFDIDYSPKALKIIGISNAADSIDLSLPTFFSFNELVPDDINLLEKRTIKFKLDTLNNEIVDLQSVRFKFYDNIQNLEHDIIVLETPIDSGQYSKFLSILTVDTLMHSSYLPSFQQVFENDNFRMVNKNFVQKIYPNYDFNNTYCIQADYYVMITSVSSKKELDYKLARKSNISKDKTVLEIKNDKYYDQAQSFFVYNNNYEILQELKNSTVLSSPIISSFLESIEGVSWTINKFSNRFHHGLVFNKKEAKKTEKNILWKVDLPPLSWGPYALKNHRTGTKDIAVVDTLNKFYLIGANGKIKWTKNLGKPIKGSINQIDAYKNNKYQMVFNTEDELHIIDILGNEIDNFPIKFSFKASNQVAVFDYDNNKDYRFILSSDNGSLYNYNIYGNHVKGWEKPRFKSDINLQLKHFTINGKDFIFSIQNNSRVNLLNRKGSNRYTVNNLIPMSKDGSFQIKKSFSIDSSSVIFEDTLGRLSELKFGGGIQQIPTFQKERDSVFLFESAKDNNLSYYLKNNKELKIIDEVGQTYKYSFSYQFELLSSLNFNDYTAIFNNSIGEIQLIDSKFRLNPTFFRGSKMLTLGDINDDNNVELVTILNQNILICYQVPKLK